MQAVVIAIGDELALGQTVDTNSAWLSARLAEHGVPTLYHQTVSDDRAAITQALVTAAQVSDVVLVSGGLGPTEDDLTREALADAMGVELVADEASLKHLRAFFRLRKREMPERNKVQAMYPAGASMIKNTCGTAPGIRAELHRAVVYVVPGVPREMRVMFDRDVLPPVVEAAAASEAGRRVILTTTVHTFGKGESDIAEQLGELMARERNPKVGTTVAAGIVSVRVRSEGSDRDAASAALEQTVDDVRQRIGAVAFGRDCDTLAEAVITLLRERGLRVATAESCTGGLIGTMLTDVSGSSDVYVGGWVTYANEMKAGQLDVPESVLAEHGAVSEPVALSMAEGALENGQADRAVAVTGIAGPGGGSAKKPVGTVWLGLARRDGDDVSSQALLLRLLGDRDAVRDRAAKCALQMLRFDLLGVPMSELGWAMPREASEHGSG